MSTKAFDVLRSDDEDCTSRANLIEACYLYGVVDLRVADQAGRSKNCPSARDEKKSEFSGLIRRKRLCELPVRAESITLGVGGKNCSGISISRRRAPHAKSGQSQLTNKSCSQPTTPGKNQKRNENALLCSRTSSSNHRAWHLSSSLAQNALSFGRARASR
jgi:hypothetical protein